MKDVLTIIDEALLRKGLSAAAASRLAVGNPSLIKNMRTGPDRSKRFNTDALRKLADVLDLEFYFGEPRSQTVVQLPGGFSERSVEPLSSAPVRKDALEMGFLPIPYHSIAAPDFRGTAPVALARGWLRASGMTAEGLAFLPVVDDLMTPKLTVGALALIDTAQTQGGDDAIWAVVVNGRYRFARVQRPATNIIVLNHDKPDSAAQVFKGDELVALRILGRVVWIAHQP